MNRGPGAPRRGPVGANGYEPPPQAVAALVAADERLRRELADVLHGKVQGGLAAVVLLLAECRRRLAAGVASAELDGWLRSASERLDALRHGELESAVGRLFPTALQLGLLPALDGLLEPFRRRFPVTMTADAETRALDDPLTAGLPPAIRLGAYRTVEAALQSVEYGSGTPRVEVRLVIRHGPISADYKGDWLRVCVRLGEGELPQRVGQGERPGAPIARVDLSVLRLRALAAGGRLEIVGRPDRIEGLAAEFPIAYEKMAGESTLDPG